MDTMSRAEKTRPNSRRRRRDRARAAGWYTADRIRQDTERLLRHDNAGRAKYLDRLLPLAILGEAARAAAVTTDEFGEAVSKTFGKMNPDEGEPR